MSEPSFVREVRAEDHEGIDALLEQAFGRPDERKLVRNLRDNGELYKEIVMPFGAGAAGYLAISRLRAPDGWLCLGPVAIHPDWQRQGRGCFMVKAEVEQLCQRLRKTLVVLGEPEFFRSAGFSKTRARGLRTPHRFDNLLLAGPGTEVPQVTLSYPKSFGLR